MSIVDTSCLMDLEDYLNDENVSIECPYCGASLNDEDDRAYALETGECPYCHESLDILDVHD